MELDIKGRFGVEIRDKRTGELTKRIESPNTITNYGIRQMALWLSRQQFPDSPLTGVQGQATLLWDEFKRITISDAGLHADPGSATPVEYIFSNDEGTKQEFVRTANGTPEHWLKFEFAHPVNIKGISVLGSYSSDEEYGWQTIGYGAANTMMIKYSGIEASGTGSPVFDGQYITTFSQHNDATCYKHKTVEAYMFATSSGTWNLASSIDGDPAYETSDMVDNPYDGTWIVASGESPAPVITKGVHSSWVSPFLKKRDDASRRVLPWITFCETTNISADKNSATWRGQNAIFRTFEGSYKGYPNYNKFYGFLPEVEGLSFYTQAGWDHGSNSCHARLYRVDVYEANMHPQNPYAIKLGTDDGSILPLASGNISLGAQTTGAEWKCNSAVQPSGYTVRFLRGIDSDEVNGVTFKEIGLFMNASGHLVNVMSEPTLENANELFARAIFDTPWSKTIYDSVTIYYEITVS